MKPWRVIVVLSLVCVVGCGTTRRDYLPTGPHLWGRLYHYDRRTVNEFFEVCGVPRENVMLWTVKDGAMLILENHYPAKREFLVTVDEDGKVTHIGPPVPQGFLNENLDPVAWFERDGGEVHVRFRDGSALRIWGKMVLLPNQEVAFRRSAGFDVDRTGQVFFLELEDGRVMFARTDCPSKALCYSKFVPDRIFFVDGLLWVFSPVRAAHGTSHMRSETFRKENAGYVLSKTAFLPVPGGSTPAPFSVTDVCSETKEVLCIDHYDPPSLSRRYVYDVRSNTWRYLGKVRGDAALFLGGDIIGNCLKSEGKGLRGAGEK